MADKESKTTRNHNEIQRWAEERDGKPAVVSATHSTRKGGGILRIDFGEKEENLEEIPWEEFFKIFDENNLEFLYQEELVSGEKSRFFKFVSAK